MQKLTRRQALAAITSLAALPRPIFDAHVHIEIPSSAKYPYAPGTKSKAIAPQSFSAEELLKHARLSGVTKINLVQTTWYGLDHSYILDVIRKDPKIFVSTGIVPAMTVATQSSPDVTMV